MTMLLRKMWKNHSKHKKLSEEWALAECEEEGWWRGPRSGSGVVDVRYAGAAPVERAASAPATAIAVRSALHTAKSLNKKLQKVNLDISAKGIIVTDADSQDNVLSVSIYKVLVGLPRCCSASGMFADARVDCFYSTMRKRCTSLGCRVRASSNGVLNAFSNRISYCSADAANARVFAVVEGRNESHALESHMVHVFVCPRRKHARALALSLAHAFNDAFQTWQSNQGSSFSSGGMRRLAPWVRFPDESVEEEEEIEEDWQSPAPLVSFA